MKIRFFALLLGALFIASCSEAPTTSVDLEGGVATRYWVNPPLGYGGLELQEQPALAFGGPALAPDFSAIPNGGFETNGGPFSTTFTDDWVIFNTSGSEGFVFAQTGTVSPAITLFVMLGFPPGVLDRFTVPAPPQPPSSNPTTPSTFSSMSAAASGGVHIWYQDVFVEFDSELNFDLFIGNRHDAFATPESLSPDVSPNQQFRVDILLPSTDPLDLDDVVSVDDGGTLLAPLYRTEVGRLPLVDLQYNQKTFDMSAFTGQTVRIRFAQVDT